MPTTSKEDMARSVLEKYAATSDGRKYSQYGLNLRQMVKILFDDLAKAGKVFGAIGEAAKHEETDPTFKDLNLSVRTMLDECVTMEQAVESLIATFRGLDKLSRLF